MVSPSSVVDDHDIKPKRYAAARAPLCLAIDPFSQKARPLSVPTDSGYQQETDVALGRPLDLPAPWNLTLDTAGLAADPS